MRSTGAMLAVRIRRGDGEQLLGRLGIVLAAVILISGGTGLVAGNDLGSPVVSGLASYRILDDSWDWRREALVHMPDKVWKKLLAAGVNPEDVVREVLGNGES